MAFPRLVPIEQAIYHHPIEVEQTLRNHYHTSGVSCSIRPGARIAITAGSRGIASITIILRTIAAMLRESGAEPFLIPAMGSHGGGTGEGQRAVLTRLGITEETVGAPVRLSGEPVMAGTGPSGAPVFLDTLATAADGIVVVNRVKPHTAFHGIVESGLCKMTAVGMGKRPGAETIHRLGLGTAITDHYRVISRFAPLSFGVAILEDAADEVTDLVVARPDEFERVDADLLVRSTAMLPHIPLDAFDILIVDMMGKDVSGTGMDTNVVGFWRRFGGERRPDYRTLIVRRLSSASGGNAMGIGMADFIPQRLADDIDRNITAANARTSQPALGDIPVTLPSDRACIETALAPFTCETARIVRIANTRDLAGFMVSENLVPELSEKPGIRIHGEAVPMQFDDTGSLREMPDITG